MYWDLHDADLVLLMSRERRGGQLAIWSLASVFLIPGIMDGSMALMTLGGSVLLAAVIVSIRGRRREGQPVLRIESSAAHDAPGTPPRLEPGRGKPSRRPCRPRAIHRRPIRRARGARHRPCGRAIR
jgi:hypothetical protein